MIHVYVRKAVTCYNTTLVLFSTGNRRLPIHTTVAGVRVDVSRSELFDLSVRTMKGALRRRGQIQYWARPRHPEIAPWRVSTTDFHREIYDCPGWVTCSTS